MKKLVENSTFKKKLRSWHLVPALHGRDGEENGNSDRLYFLALQNHCGQLTAATKLKMLAPWKKSCDKLRQHIKKQKFQFADKGP